MTRHDIFAVSDGVQLTLARGVAGEPDALRAAAQAEADQWRRGCRVVVVPSGTMPAEPQPREGFEL